jgi:enoyl-CoA hydratase
MGDKVVKTSVEALEDGWIGIVTIDNPPVNAMTPEVRDGLWEAFTSLMHKTEIGALIFTGTGERAFCGGLWVKDVPNLGPVDSWIMTRKVTEVWNALYNFPVPVICAVNGPAVGAGFGMATRCDFVVASEKAFFSMPEISVGVLGGPSALYRVLPKAKVRKLIYTAERMSAQEAYRLGWVEKVVPLDQLMTEAKNMAKGLVNKSPFAMRLAKLSCIHSELLNRQDAYEWECRWTAELTGHEDSKEAALAYMEKRKPKFKGVKYGVEI